MLSNPDKKNPESSTNPLNIDNLKKNLQKSDKDASESIDRKDELIVNDQQQEKVVNSEDQNEYIEDININSTTDNNETKKGDNKVVNTFTKDNDDDEEEKPDTDIEIGDDPDETTKKIPIM